MNKHTSRVINRFTDQMIREMQNNSHKGSILEWNNFDNMICELEYHKAKMMLAIRSNDKPAIKEYIADCANILMAIGNLGGLYDEDTPDDGMCSETLPTIFKRIPNDNANTGVTSVNMNYTK